MAGGMSLRMAQYLLPITNAWGIPGRLLPAILADRFGRFNITTIVRTLSAVAVLACWIPAHSNAIVIVFGSMYGFLIGGAYHPSVTDNATRAALSPLADR